MKIDTHVHLTPPDIIRSWRKIGEREPYFNLLSNSPVNHFATAEDVVAQLDTVGFDRAVVFGFAFRDPGLCRATNDYVMDSVRRFPDRLIGYLSVSPAEPGLETEIDRCLAGGLRGVGELYPDGQGWRLEERADTERLAGLCRERRLPLIVHSNEPVGHYYAGKTTTTPVKLDAFVAHHPDNTVIFAHWGGGAFFYELMPEQRSLYRHVYYDTAATPYLYTPAVYRAAQACGVLDRVLLGSDFPLLPLSRYLRGLAESGLDPAECAQITGGNAAKMLAGGTDPIA